MPSASSKVSARSARGRDWQIRRARPQYDPSTDGGLVLWLDATNTATTSLKDNLGNAITNGATIGTWSSQAGNARDFTQWFAFNRPTWDSTGINGVPAAKFIAASSQILTTQMNLGDFASMSAQTIMVAMKRTSANGLAYASTMVDSGTGGADIVQAQLNMGTVFTGGGRRKRGDSFDTVGPGAAIPANGVFIDTIAFGYANGRASLWGNGVEQSIFESWQTSGTTDANDPKALSVGAFAQFSLSTAAGFADGWVGEVLIWLGEKTSDQLVGPHDYMCNKWGGSLL